jgi:hypothetical protein
MVAEVAAGMAAGLAPPPPLQPASMSPPVAAPASSHR